MDNLNSPTTITTPMKNSSQHQDEEQENEKNAPNRQSLERIGRVNELETIEPNGKQAVTLDHDVDLDEAERFVRLTNSTPQAQDGEDHIIHTDRDFVAPDVQPIAVPGQVASPTPVQTTRWDGTGNMIKERILSDAKQNVNQIDDEEAVRIYQNLEQNQSKCKSRKHHQNYSDEDSIDDEQSDADVDVTISDKRKKFKKMTSFSAFKMRELSNSSANQHPRYSKFKNYSSIFDNLTKSNSVDTPYPIISMLITYDSTRVIAVTKKDDTKHKLTQYNIETYDQTAEELYQGDYIRMKDVEQNSDGSKFAVAYIDDGRFKIRVFGKEQRQKAEIEREEFDVNQALGINHFTIPIQGFPDPFITCTFVNDDLLFVNLFHNSSLTHYHFFYKISQRSIHRQYNQVLECTKINFPYKCFYNDTLNEIYSFYRQGQAFRIPVDLNNIDQELEIQFERITDKDLGQMYLINDKALVARSSGKVMFFKREKDEDTQKRYWTLYKTIYHKGLIYYIKGNIRIQVTTEEKIYFYKMDLETYQPILESVMFNFMRCNQMMFGSKVKYGITYKTGELCYNVFRRKYEHNFKVNLVKKDFSSSIGISLEQSNKLLVSQIDRILMFDSTTFEELEDQQINVQLLESNARERNEILGMCISSDESHLAIITGKNLIKNEQFPNQLFLYTLKEDEEIEQLRYKFTKNIKLKDNPELHGICMQFYFKYEPRGESVSLIFAQKNRIIEYNFVHETINVLGTFEQDLIQQPLKFQLNDDQTNSIICTNNSTIFFKVKEEKTFYLDQMYQTSQIEQILYDQEDQVFYLLANKYKGKLGLFVVRLFELNPNMYTFLLKIKNKLDVGDANLQVLRNKEKEYKELIVSYKTIYLNNYNVTSIDLSQKSANGDYTTVFRHESFQLWETSVMGLLVDHSLDYAILTQNGIDVIALGSFDKRIVTGKDGQERVIHCLEQINYLKVDPDNLIEFESLDNEIAIHVKQKYTLKDQTDTETQFDPIYTIKLQQMTLRELLFIQSAQRLPSSTLILELVKSQPTPHIFMNSFLELDGTNLANILSFDSGSINAIFRYDHENQKFLNDKYFNPEIPIFYRNKITKKNNQKKYYYRNAIDNALRNNQIQAVNIIINYITRYQNNWISSFLFKKNIGKLMHKGVPVEPLLKSNVFDYRFDYEQWPNNHTENENYTRPYNGSIFEIRNAYREIFWEDHFKRIEDDIRDSSKIYKVTYCLNLLPQLGTHTEMKNGKYVLVEPEFNFVDLLTKSTELKIFEAEGLQELIDFKWNTYANQLQKFSFAMHLVYLTTFLIYIDNVYMKNDEDQLGVWQLILAAGVSYPTFYEILQIYKDGIIDHVSNLWNVNDFLMVTTGILTVVLGQFMNQLAVKLKIVLILSCLSLLIKTFYFLRIFNSLSYLVAMLGQVISDLRVFALFFTLLIILLSQSITILGLGNTRVPGKFQDTFQENDPSKPGSEYDNLGLLVGNFLMILRISVGDFDFEATKYLSPTENLIYWLIWVETVAVTCIIFLNFIIAEASNSYSIVKGGLDKIMYQETSDLINETEMMTPHCMKTPARYPKYIIVRSIQN